MKLYFLGGAMEIGGSCIYIRVLGKGILLDCGIRQTGSGDPLPDFCTIQEQGGLDAIIVSHAHMDHIGALPIISKAYPQARIYMTAMTAELTRVLLYDSLKIMSSKENEIPHYSEPDVQAMLGRVFPIGYQMPFPILDRFTLSFFPAGHIAGAACIYLTTEEGSLFYSGDLCAFPQRTIDGIRIPRLRPDVAITEATYGNRLHANRQAEEKRLVDLVGECVRQKKKILIPAFALGRAQEVLLILRAAIQNQEIPPVPVYVDGMIRAVNAMYTRNPIYLKSALGKRILKGNEPFYTEHIQPVTASRKREELLAGDDPVIFVSSCGMLTGGPSVQYAKHLIPSENACVIFTGYQDEEAPGRQLLNLVNCKAQSPEEPSCAPASLNVDGITLPVRCRVEQIGLSAHGDKSEITALLESLSPRHIFLVHGSEDSIHELGDELNTADYRRQVYLPECGQCYELELHAKRKQQLFLPMHTMRMGRIFTRADEKLLWSFWRQNYPDKTFSLAQVAYIWFGKTPTEFASDAAFHIREQASRLMEEIDGEHPHREAADGGQREKHDVVLQSMQRILLNSSYFSPNARRLFLIEANSPETVAEALTPKELTQQKLLDKVESVFPDCPYRKISYHNDRKEVVLQFDYPDAQDWDEFNKRATDFTNTTGWTIHISPSMNHSAASLLLSLLFGESVSKISYYPERKLYSVTLTEGAPSVTIESAAAQFQKATGWGLEANGQPLSQAQCPTEEEALSARDFFVPSEPAAAPMEQNMAFSYIEQAFEKLTHKPDKKSLKQDAQGKYMEIGFISPMIGRRYAEALQDAANRTGWRLHIAEKVSQNELIRIAQLLCMKYGIVLEKNPSYLPGKKLIQLKTKDSVTAGIQEKIEGKFLEMTGCACIFTD